MSLRATQLRDCADRQVAELLSLVSVQTPQTLRQPCGREKLGDGSLGALIAHTADNYRRIAGFALSGGGEPSGHMPSEGGRRLSHLRRVLGHRRPDHGSDYTAQSADPERIAAQLTAVRESLLPISALTEQQLDGIPPAGSFRFCDGKRDLGEVLSALLKHQDRQLDAIRAACG